MQKYARMHKYAGIKVCKYAHICTYASMHINESMQICTYAHMQVCKYAGMQVYACLYKKLNTKTHRWPPEKNKKCK